MEKLFNWISIISATVGGILAQFFGGWDELLFALLFFAVLDYVTGLIKAWYKKEMSSAVGYKGILKKVMMFIVVAVACEIGVLTGNFLPLREAVIVFFVVNEALSLLENIGEFIPLPSGLKEVLIQLREKTHIINAESEDTENDQNL